MKTLSQIVKNICIIILENKYHDNSKMLNTKPFQVSQYQIKKRHLNATHLNHFEH